MENLRFLPATLLAIALLLIPAVRKNPPPEPNPAALTCYVCTLDVGCEAYGPPPYGDGPLGWYIWRKGEILEPGYCYLPSNEGWKRIGK